MSEIEKAVIPYRALMLIAWVKEEHQCCAMIPCPAPPDSR